jgi:hypothetical protein
LVANHPERANWVNSTAIQAASRRSSGSKLVSGSQLNAASPGLPAEDSIDLGIRQRTQRSRLCRANQG